MTINKTYRCLKYLVILLLFLICTNHEVKAYEILLPLMSPNYTVSGNEISINCNVFSEPVWENMSFETNIFNFQVRNSYSDQNGNTQNLVSYLGIYESVYLLLINYPDIKESTIGKCIGIPLLIDKLLTNSRLHYYWKQPIVKARALDWYCTNFVGMNSALFQGKDINPIYSLKPELGLRIGIQKILNEQFFDPSDCGDCLSTPFIAPDIVKRIGLYFDLGYRYSIDFQKGAKPDGMGNIFISIGISSSFKKQWFLQ